MSKSPFIFGALAVAVAIGGVASLAQAVTDTTPHDRSLVISMIDSKPHDGTLSLSEVDAAAAKKFANLDTDSDGTLDASELTGIMTRSQLATDDTDKDDTVSKTEYLALVKARFDAADTDHDGTLDAAELSSEKGIALVELLTY